MCVYMYIFPVKPVSCPMSQINILSIVLMKNVKPKPPSEVHYFISKSSVFCFLDRERGKQEQHNVKSLAHLLSRFFSSAVGRNNMVDCLLLRSSNQAHV